MERNQRENKCKRKAYLKRVKDREMEEGKQQYGEKFER